MAPADPQGPRHDAQDGRRASAGVHGLRCFWSYLAAVGLVGTWYLNLTYAGLINLASWFANSASWTKAVDLIVVVGVAAIFYVSESRRLGWHPAPVPLAFVVLSVAVAVSFALPLFLALRERNRGAGA